MEKDNVVERPALNNLSYERNRDAFRNSVEQLLAKNRIYNIPFKWNIYNNLDENFVQLKFENSGSISEEIYYEIILYFQDLIRNCRK